MTAWLPKIEPDGNFVMNIVVDSNVLISGIGFGGKPGVIHQAVKNGVLLAYSSEFLLNEVERNLSKVVKPKDVVEETRLLRSTCVVVVPKIIPTVLRDTPDNQVLAITHEANIDAIITGDKELLAHQDYNGVPIMSVDQFLAKNAFLEDDIF